MSSCVDFRRFNAVIVPETYLIPLMNDLIDSLSNAKIFTMLDALWGYWQVPIAEEDRDKAKFTSHMRMFRYKRMPLVYATRLQLSSARWIFSCRTFAG